MEFEGVTYTSEALIDAEETVTEWRIFKRAVVRESDEMMQKKKLAEPPTLQVEMGNLASSPSLLLPCA